MPCASYRWIMALPRNSENPLSSMGFGHATCLRIAALPRISNGRPCCFSAVLSADRSRLASSSISAPSSATAHGVGFVTFAGPTPTSTNDRSETAQGASARRPANQSTSALDDLERCRAFRPLIDHLVNNAPLHCHFAGQEVVALERVLDLLERLAGVVHVDLVETLLEIQDLL